MSEECMKFSCPADEITYWKGKADQWKKQADSSKEELDEFQEGSRELEAELEAQLEQMEIKNKELKSLTNRLQMENDQIKDKLDQCNREYHYQITELETELSEIKGIKDKLAKYVRELEQQNDDLERAKRSTLASLEDFEGRMNAAIERNAFLESELDEKEQLKNAVQRLKDETRDLRSELKVLNPQFEEEPDNDRSLEKNAVTNQQPALSDTNKLAESAEGKTSGAGSGNGVVNGNADAHNSGIGTQGGKLVNGVSGGGQHLHHSSSANSPPLTPSARISALGIVGDLLRKVGALELKLVSCRNIVKENGKDAGLNTAPGGGSSAGDRSSAVGGFASLNSTNASAGGGGGVVDRTKRLPRGGSSPALLIKQKTTNKFSLFALRRSKDV